MVWLQYCGSQTKVLYSTYSQPGTCPDTSLYSTTAIVTFAMFLYFLKTVQSLHTKVFTDVFGFIWTIIYKKKKLHSLKTFARSYFGLFWGLIWMLFLYLLRTVKHFLINVFADVFSYYSSAFCTKQKFHSMSSSPASHLGIFCSVLRYFSLSWELFLCLFSYEIFHIYS